MLSHYWTADDPIETRREQFADWIDDLIEFGPAVVAVACRDWRQTQSRRPTPADIRRLCIAEQIRRQEEVRRLLPPPPRPEPEPVQLSEEERAHCIALADKVLATLKWPLPEDIPTGYCAVEKRKEREYTAAELRAARIALGIEQPEAVE